MRNRKKRFIILLSLLLSFSCSSLAKPTEVIYLIPENFTDGIISENTTDTDRKILPCLSYFLTAK